MKQRYLSALHYIKSHWLQALMLSACVNFLLGYALQRIAQSPPDVAAYTARLQKTVQRYETEVLNLFYNGTFILNAVQNTSNLDTLKHYEQQPYTVLIFDEYDSLVYWNNNKAFPYRTDIGQTDTIVNVPYRVQNSSYIFLKAPYNPLLNGRVYYYTLVGLIPIHEQFSIQNEYLHNNFSLLPHEESSYIDISEDSTAHSVVNGMGAKVAYIKAAPDTVLRHWAWWSLLCYSLGSLSLVMALYAYAQYLVRARSFWWGILTLVAGVGALRLLTYYFQFPSIAKTFDLFNRPFTSLPHWWSNSLGEFLIEVGMILFGASFIHKELRLGYLRYWTREQRLWGGFGMYSILLQLLFVLQQILQNIVHDSLISFQFDNISEIELDSFLALAGACGLFLAIFITVHKLFSIFRAFGYSVRRRIGLLALAMLVQTPLWWLVGAPFAEMSNVLIFGTVFAVLLSLFDKTRIVNLVWLSAWLIYFSLFTMIVFQWGNRDKEIDERLNFAQALANERDLAMEEQFGNVEKAILDDDFFNTYFSSTFISRRQAVERIMFRYLDNYFFGRYDYNVAVYSERGMPHRGEKRDFVELMGMLNKSQKTRSEHLYFYSDIEGRYIYLARLPITKGNVLQGVIIIELLPKQTPNRGNTFVELLQMPRTRAEKLAAEYEYALYKRDRRVFNKSTQLPAVLPYAFATPSLNHDSITWVDDAPYLLYRSSSDNLSIVRLPTIGFWQMLTIFAYIFCTGVVLLAMMGVVIWVVAHVFQYDIWEWQYEQSLRERIQRGILLVSIFSFVAIAWITILYFRNEYTDYHKTNLTNRVKTTAQLASSQVQLDGDSLVVLPSVQRLAELSQLDVNMYSLTGHLISSSSENVFDRRLISRQMNPVALYRLQTDKLEQFILSERVSDFSYLSAYVVLKDERAEPIAYLNLPYDSEASNTARAREVAQFLGTLLNVYVLFLMLAGTAALLIARSVTSPLAVIADKLRQVKLDQQNEPLEWKIRDEVGELVQRYNQMIVDLEENKQALERTERETAWRDMAKQVAHEIKNPLTPMKLSIQLLQKLFTLDPEKARKKLDSTIQSLIEQIDNLAHIASEFSNFAKMPTAYNEEFNLSELVQSVFQLFKEEGQHNEAIELTLDCQNPSAWVFADKNQLMRVLNNLLKNAIQAIPEHVRGNIHLQLTTTTKKAIIAVKDNGTGISEEGKKRVFVPYFTTKSSGSGIGLAMCKNIVEQANGSIYFESKEGEGTTFFVEIPLYFGEHA